MSGGKLWRNSNGKLIASDGRLVLSDSCPCVPIYDLYGTFNLRHEFYWGTDETTIPDDIPASTIPGGFNIEIGGITTPTQYSIVSVETIEGSSSMVTYESGASGLYPADWSFYYLYPSISK